MAKKKENGMPAKKESTKTSPGPWDPFSSLRGDFEDMLERFSRDWPSGGGLGRMMMPAPMRRLRKAWSLDVPAVDFLDKGDCVELRAELPGMTEKDVEVEVSDSLLTISGEKKDEHEEGEKEGRYYLCERSYGSFERSVRLPDGVDLDTVDAKVRDGVLVVTISKTPEARAKAKKVKVQAG